MLLALVVVAVVTATIALPAFLRGTLDDIDCRITWEKGFVDTPFGDATQAWSTGRGETDMETPDEVVVVYEGHDGFGPTTDPIDRDMVTPPLELAEEVVVDDPEDVREVRQSC